MRSLEFGHRLDLVLRARGVSKLGFSKALQGRREVRQERGEPPLRKVDRSALYAFLQGRDFPPVDTLAEMAEILRVRPGWLADGEEPLDPDLDPAPTPIWLIDGHSGAWKRPGVPKRIEARLAFEEAFFPRSGGYREAEPLVRAIFGDLLARRLRRRRKRGDRGPAYPLYRAETARGLYLKCFLDVMDELTPGTTFSSPKFTSAFLSNVAGWVEDESA